MKGPCPMTFDLGLDLPRQVMNKMGQTSLQTRMYTDSIGSCEGKRTLGVWAPRGRQPRPLLRPRPWSRVCLGAPWEKTPGPHSQPHSALKGSH